MPSIERFQERGIDGYTKKGAIIIMKNERISPLIPVV
jgi:hypothetical protein